MKVIQIYKNLLELKKIQDEISAYNQYVLIASIEKQDIYKKDCEKYLSDAHGKYDLLKYETLNLIEEACDECRYEEIFDLLRIKN